MKTKIAIDFSKKRIPGIRSIKKHPAIDQEKFKTYGNLFIQKYFIDDGKKPVKMVSFGAKSKDMIQPIVFILYDLKMQPAVFFEFKKDEYNEERFLEFIQKIITKTKFKIPKKRIGEGAADIIQILPSLILPFISLAAIGYYYFLSIKYAATEKYVKSTVEDQLNKELFEGQQQKESGFEMFATLENYIQMIINKRMNSLIICGPPGMSKTYMIRRTLYFNNKKPGSDYTIEKGSSLGVNSVYQLIYDNRNKLLILDDFDTPLSNEDIVNLIKAITDSYGRRIVSLAPEKRISSQGGGSTNAAPNKFEYKGQLIIITNKKKEDLDLALRSRSPVVEVSFNTKQIIKSMEKLIKFVAPQVDLKYKMEVFNYIKILQKNSKSLDVTFRSIKACIDARMGNPDDWKTMAELILGYKGKPIKENLLTKKMISLYLDSLDDNSNILI